MLWRKGGKEMETFMRKMRRMARPFVFACLIGWATLGGAAHAESDSANVSPPAVPAAASQAGTETEDWVMRFQVFSDVHVMASNDPWQKMAAQKWIRALEDLRPYLPDFMVVNGDLTNGKEGDYRLFKQIVQTYAPWPVYATMGNHEYYEIFTNPNITDQELRWRFDNFFQLDKPYYDRYIHGYHFIFLAPEAFKAHYKQLADGAYISPEQLAWFRQTLAKDEGLTFVFLHQPLDGTVTQSDPGSVQQSREIREILREHKGPVIWFSGHTHATMLQPGQIRQIGNVLFVGGSSTFTIDNSLDKSESRMVEVYRDRLVFWVRDHVARKWVQPYVYPLK
jgi:Icc protein